MKTVLLTAGLGTRLRPYTLKVPKPLIPFLGVPIAKYALFPFEREVTDLIYNVHHLPEQVQNFMQTEWGDRFRLICSDESDEILDSGGALKKMEPHLAGDSFCVVNGDNFVLPQSPQLMTDIIEAHKNTQSIATLVVCSDPRVGVDFGAVLSQKGRVTGFSKKLVPGYQHWHFLGIAIYEPRVFQFFKPGERKLNLFYDLLARAIEAGEKISVYNLSPVTWFETGNVQDFLNASMRVGELLSSSDKKILPSHFGSWWGHQKKMTPIVEQDFPDELKVVSSLLQGEFNNSVLK